MGSYEDRKKQRRAQSRASSARPKARVDRRGERSTYEGRVRERPAECVQIAATNPSTGELEWEPNWAWRVQGWAPIDELLRRREFGG